MPGRASASAKDVLQSAQLARAFLLRGLRVHKRSQRLLLALFRLESELTAWVMDRRDDLPAAAGLDADAVAAGEPAALVLESLLQTLDASAQCSAAETRQLLDALAAAAAACPPVAERCLADIRQRLGALPAVPTELPAAEPLAVPDPEADNVARLDAAATAGGLGAVWAAQRDSSSAGVRALRRYAELELELGSGSSDPATIARVRREFERLAGRLGPCNVAFWTAYLRFEELSGDPALIGQLDWRARKFLRPELLNAYNVARLCPQLGDP